MNYYMVLGESLLKLTLAIILGGLIGGEREYKNRPAGLRTHMLVCIGATLVQITGINFYNYFYANTNFSIDPMRLGAQVISGIGFLGAGTIIKEGVSIRGLTTAASIWLVGCLGLTIGSGLYAESILATFCIYVALKGFKALEVKLSRGRKIYYIEVIARNTPEKIGEIGIGIGNSGLMILNIDMRNVDSDYFTVEFIVKAKGDINHSLVIENIVALEGIKDIKFI